jgi:hypothetical protein
MSLSRQKNAAWCVFFAGLGGTVIFVLIAALDGIRGIRALDDIYAWPILSLAMSIAGTLRLRTLYRREPAEDSGKWHLSVTDLIALAGLTGLFLAVAQSILTPRVFLERGIAVSLLCGIANVLGLLIASRRNIQRPWHRILFANAYSLRLFGALGTGTFALLIFLTLSRGTFGLFLDAIVHEPHYRTTENGIVQAIRLSLVCLPLGLVGCWFVEAKMKNNSN